MNKYLVTLNLIIGECEKTAYSVQIANSEKEAGIGALRNQCHGEPDFDEFPDMDACWDMHEMIYEVYNIQPLSDEDYEVFKRLGIAH